MTEKQETIIEFINGNQKKIDALMNKLTPENSMFRISPESATAGFYMRHIGEAMHSIANMGFQSGMSFQPQTLRQPADPGHAFDLSETKQFVDSGFDLLRKIVNERPNSEIDIVFSSPFGDQTLLSMMSFTLNHNSHHAGQIELTIKKGKVY